MAPTSATYPIAGEASGNRAAAPVALGPDLVMYEGSGSRMVLYHSAAGLLGTFDDPAAAWSAIDAVDMPEGMIAGE